MMVNRKDDDAWHLDKKVPLALLFAILVQTAMGFWWASGLTERVTVLERGAVSSAPQADRLTRVEVKVDGVQRTLDKIEALVQQRTESPAARPRTDQQ